MISTQHIILLLIGLHKITAQWCPCLSRKDEIAQIGAFHAVEQNQTLILKAYLEEKAVSPNTIFFSDHKPDLVGLTLLMYAVKLNNPTAVKLLLKKHYLPEVDLRRECIDCYENGYTAMRYVNIETDSGRKIAKLLNNVGGKTSDICNPDTHVMDLTTMQCGECHEFCVSGCIKPQDPKQCVSCRAFKTVDGECINQEPNCPVGASLKSTSHYEAECVCDLPYQKVSADGCVDCEATCDKCGIKGCDVCVFPWKRDINLNCVETCESIDGLICNNCDMILEQASNQNKIEFISRMNFNKHEMIKTAIDHGDLLATQALMCSKYPKANDTLYYAVDSCNYGIIKSVISLKYLNRKYVNRLDGATPLHLAAEKCPDVRIIELLMQEIHQTKRDYKGFTALMTAVKFQNNVAFEKLLAVYERKHLNIKSRDHKKSALHLAADNCDKALFNILLKNGASQHTRDNYGRNPLEYIDFRCRN